MLPNSFPTWLCWFTLLPPLYEKLICSISFAFRIVSLFHFSHCDGYVFHNGFNCISLVTDVVGHLFICLSVRWITSFVKNLFTASAYLCQIVVFFKLTYWECFTCSKYKSFAGYMFCKYSLPLCDLPFHSQWYLLMNRCFLVLIWSSLGGYFHYDWYFKNKSLFLPYNLFKWHLYSGISYKVLRLLLDLLSW